MGGTVLRVAACLSLIVPGVVQAEWVRIGGTDTGAAMSMDAERIRTVGGKVQAWIQLDYANDRSVRYRKGVELWSYDCAAQTMKVLSVVNYDSYGKVVSSRSNPVSYGDYGYQPVTPDTVGETGFKIACAGSD